MKWRCLSCGGIYLDPQPDGGRYFHVCPELRVVEAAASRMFSRAPSFVRVPIEDRRDEREVYGYPEYPGGLAQAVLLGNRAPGKGRVPHE